MTDKGDGRKGEMGGRLSEKGGSLTEKGWGAKVMGIS